MEKVKGPLMALPFLGLILNSVKQEIRMLPEKLVELMQELDRRSTRCKATKRELHSLIGKLPFAVRAVPGGSSTPALLDSSECRGKCRHHLVTDIPANMERHCQVYRLELSAG